MEQPNTVEVLEVCRVAPPPDHLGSTSPKSLPLTFFELYWLRFPPPQTLYFYEISTHMGCTNFFFDSILPRLKHSLSLTLQHFLPHAGNITWPPTSPKPVIAYAKGDAVSMIVAKSYSDFHRLSSTDDVAVCEAMAHRPLVPPLGRSNNESASPLLAIQVTFFPKSNAFSIGFTVHKAVLDGNSFFLFVKSWAHICKSLGSGDDIGEHQSAFCLPSKLKPFYDRTSLFKAEPASKLEAICSRAWLNLDGPNNRSVTPWEYNILQPDLIRGTFRLSRADIQKLKQLVLHPDHIHDWPLRVSTFSVICAYTWVCLTKAEEVSNDMIELVFSVDCRSRLKPPLPATYLGDCVAPRYVVIKRDVMFGEQGFAASVNAINESLKSLENQSSVLDGADKWITKVAESKHPLSSKTGHKLYSVASSPGFKCYETDFGWGRPRKVEVVSIDGTGAMSLSDNRNGDGVDIGVVVKKHQMEAFASMFAQGFEFGSRRQHSLNRKITSFL